MVARLRIKSITIFILVVVLAIVYAPSVFAGSTSTPGTVSGVSVTAQKYVLPSSSTWLAGVKSSAASSIGTIGYTWWTVREECRQSNGSYSITWQWQSSTGRANYGSTSLLNEANNYYHGCASNRRKLWSMGQHDFKQNAAVWQPTINYPQTYP